MSEASARETRGFWPRREDDLVELNNALVLLRFGDLNGAETRLSWLIFPESFDKLALPLAEAYAKRGQLEQARRVLRVLAMEVEDERVETCLRLEMLFQLCAAYARNGLHEELLAVLHRHDAMLRSTGCRLTRKLTEEYMVDVASVLPFERINTIVDRLAPGKAASRFHVPLAIGASARGDDEAALMHLEKVTDEISVLYTLERMATEQGKRGKLDQAERTLAMAGAGASSALSMMEVWKELRRTGQLEAAQAWLDKAESLARKWLSRRTVSDGDRDDWHLVLIALRDASADMGMPDRELYWTSELRRLLRDKVEDYFWRGVNATDLIDNWRQRDDEHDVVEALALLVRPDSSSRIDFNVLEYAVTTLVAMGRVEEAAAYTDMHPAAARHSKFALTWARQRARAGRWAEARWLAVREPQLRKCEDALQELLREQVWQGDLHAAMTTANHLCIGSGTPSGYSTIARMLVHPLILQDEAPWDARTQELRKGVKFIVK
jgi:thioredoxin-like negative regulator of GroEL